MKKTFPFAITTQIIKYLEINLTKDVKELHTENYVTLSKEIEKNTMKWKGSVFKDWIVKMSMLPEVICRFNTIPFQIPVTFF